MKLENHTRYRSADLEAVILGALAEFGITKHGRDRVVVKYKKDGQRLNGKCVVGEVVSFNGHPRMRLWLSRPEALNRLGSIESFLFPDDVQTYKPGLRVGDQFFHRFVWLVRHEVGHWAGLHHREMAGSLRRYEENAHRKGPFGSQLPLPAWAKDLQLRIDPEVEKKTRPTHDARREAKIEHARTMLARAKRRETLAKTITQRWTRRLAAAERAIAAAASKS